jgi:hypothetical protein
VIDISDPTNPTLEAICDTLDNALGVAISGNYAYVADGGSGLQVIDITNPTSPTLAGSYSTPDFARGVAISGDCAYVADGYSGLQVIDISNPTSPALAGSYDTPGYARDVTISGDYAYVADDLSGLQAIDISDPTIPTLMGSHATPDQALGVAISGDYAYVADDSLGLQVIEVFQRRYDTESGTAQSLMIDEADEMILQARLNATYSDSIHWELSADSGGSWQEFLPGGGYQAFVTPGSGLLWRSYHVRIPSQPALNPTCTDLEVDWLYAIPVIDSVEDIPSDQGHQVRITWARSSHDCTYGSIVNYAIYRRIDGDVTQSGESVPFETGPGLLPLYPPGDWDFVASVPAATEDNYAIVVPTLADSSISGGMCYTTFFVRAFTETLGIHFDSYPDSGYSVDNLAPAPPPNFRMTSPTALAWDEAQEEDFNHFSVYGSANAGLDSTAALIAHTIGTTMDIPDDIYDYYHVTSTDFSGNQGEASSVENIYAGVSHVEDLPTVYALRQSKPNPFDVRTVIGFDLPEPTVVRLEVYDTQGRLVRTLTESLWSAGRHSAAWVGQNDAGQLTGPGIYFSRIQAGNFSATQKVMRLR